MTKYRNNHYVPQWYQKGFLSTGIKKFHYLDLFPEEHISNGHKYLAKSLHHWHPLSCFSQEDLYTTKLGSLESVEIEKEFFGEIDRKGQKALEHISNFCYNSVNTQLLKDFIVYMSAQKLRTPKGLDNLAEITGREEKNEILARMTQLRDIFCATWMEGVWCIADASNSQYKFILSDHPITIFNHKCDPSSEFCKGSNDPDVLLNGTHTIFPLNLNKILIVTNLSWARNPYQNPLELRPHPRRFGEVLMDLRTVHTERMLNDDEVLTINSIIKKRAYKYIAAPHEEWLYPERTLGDLDWEQIGKSYLLMPDPRLMVFTSGILIGGRNGPAQGRDPFGQTWHPDHDNKAQLKEEFKIFSRFQAEFVNLFGQEHRGKSGKFQ